MDTKTTTKEEISTEVDNIIILYAYGNQQLKTWFLSRTKQSILPKGSRLLFTLDCILTNKIGSTNSTYPSKSDIVYDIKGVKYEVMEVNWT